MKHHEHLAIKLLDEGRSALADYLTQPEVAAKREAARREAAHESRDARDR